MNFKKLNKSIKLNKKSWKLKKKANKMLEKQLPVFMKYNMDKLVEKFPNMELKFIISSTETVWLITNLTLEEMTEEFVSEFDKISKIFNKYFFQYGNYNLTIGYPEDSLISFEKYDVLYSVRGRDYKYFID